MGPKQDFFCDIEGILHIPRWVIFRQIHPFKVIIVLLHFKAVNDLIPHPDKDIFDFFTGLGQNMTVTTSNWTTWKGHIDAFAS